MTIGIGFQCYQGVLLGSDMELTKVAKYKGRKHFFKHFDGVEGRIFATYAGLEDDMRCVWEELENGIEEAEKVKPLTLKGARTVLEEAIRKVIRDKKSSFQMLVGMGHSKNDAFIGPPTFFRCHGPRLVPGRNWEIIGAGDCELTRYLTDLIHPPNPNLQQAALWAAHIIRISNSFVQTVGQGIQLTAIGFDGNYEIFNADGWMPQLKDMESLVGRLWTDIYDTTLPQDEFEENIQNILELIVKKRKLLPLRRDQKDSANPTEKR